MTVRVLIADDQQLVPAGFTMILATADDIEVVGEATNGHEAVQFAASLAPDVVLMDIQMPGLNGIEATKRIVTGHATVTRVLILTPLTSTSTSTTPCAQELPASCSKTCLPSNSSPQFEPHRAATRSSLPPSPVA